ncbi:MAG: M23 family metallopeptidase [Desulfobacterales bacterium]|nr:M23 family metallopeptidase [Desulfobacterales bacterium]
MEKKISFVMFNDGGASVRRATLSEAFFRSLCFFLMAGLIFLAYFVYDYHQAKKERIQAQLIQDRVSSQTEEIIFLRKQVQSFSGKINILKNELVSLNAFEKKIRIIANLDHEGSTTQLFGVGGPGPEDLDARIPATRKNRPLLRQMHDQTGQIHLAANRQEKGFHALLKDIEKRKNFLASTPTIRPTRGWVTSKFGQRTSPMTGRKEFHEGLDIATERGTTIVATADGVISFVGLKGSLGKAVVIDHGYGLVTRYGHIYKSLKKDGTPVKRGETIALVGQSGRTTGPHVHYEVLLNGIPVNPEEYILN